MAEQNKRHPSSQPPALSGVEGTLDLNNPLCLGAEGSMVKGFVGELAGYPLGSGAHVSIEAEPLPDISKLRCFLT